jgi:hypothetical protein
MIPLYHYYWHYQVLSTQPDKIINYNYGINNNIPFEFDSGQEYLKTPLQGVHLYVGWVHNGMQ